MSRAALSAFDLGDIVTFKVISAAGWSNLMWIDFNKLSEGEFTLNFWFLSLCSNLLMITKQLLIEDTLFERQYAIMTCYLQHS